MSKSTDAEIVGIPYGAIGVTGPVALQSALDKLRKPAAYETLVLATDALVAGEVAIVFVADAPVLIAKNKLGAAFQLALTAV